MSISWDELNNLEKEYGDSFYILDLRKFENNYKDFLEGFRKIYPKANFGYSYKTNYVPLLCKSVNLMGGYAEVVSQMEYELALQIGVKPEKIIFNGPLKHQNDLEKAIIKGSKINLDCQEEVEIVAALARRFPEHKIEVGIRCNFDIGASRISRFGFDVEAGELDNIFRAFAELDNCSVAGLHCHLNTVTRSIDSYALRTQKILELSDYYFQNSNPKFLDIGGGFFSSMADDLRQQFDFHIPSYQEYATAIASQFKERFLSSSNLELIPELILEPGVAVVADVMKYVGKIVGLKTIRSRKIALVVGSIHNVKPTMTDKKLSSKLYVNPNISHQHKIKGPCDLVGYTCMEHDCLYKDYAEEVGIGDYLVFDNIGAYTIVFKPPFIRPNPPIISYDSAMNEYSLCRRKETSADVFSTYVI
ncbi:MAG: decarboxylase [Cyanobacteria bacterium J06643_5]